MTACEAIRELIDARHALVWIETAEEARVLRCLHRLIEQVYRGLPLDSWDCIDGIGRAVGDADDSGDPDPVTAVARFIDSDGAGFLVMHDLGPFLAQPRLQRILRRAAVALADRGHAVLFIVSAVVSIPRPLREQVTRLRLPPPDEGELTEVVATVLAEFTGKALPADWQREVLMALKGLTLDQSRRVMYRVFNGRPSNRAALVGALGDARVAETAASAYLDYVVPAVALDDIGGAPNLKDWVRKRSGVLTRANADSGLPIPKGVLLMGISGCGKSLFAKAIASTWRLPLFRLDISRVYANIEGNPEATFLQALAEIEALAPAVLWIDEIENGIGMGTGDAQAASHILSAFLTWMQEKPPLVFVAATANRIEALPAEMIRKGRFDQVFFCDLPSDEERGEIFTIHIRRNQGDPADFDLPRLLIETQGWNAAEIEQLVVAARIDADAAGRRFNGEDIVRLSRSIVPLAQTMSEQIKFIRDWAWNRATPVSGVAQEIQFEVDADPVAGQP